MAISRAEALRWKLSEDPRTWSLVESVIDEELALHSMDECINVSVVVIVERARVGLETVLAFDKLIIAKYQEAGWEVRFFPPLDDAHWGYFEFR